MTSQNSPTFGLLIKDLRGRIGLTQTQMAAKLDMDTGNLSKVENGKREFDINKISLLSKLTGINELQLKSELLSERFAKDLLTHGLDIRVLELVPLKAKHLISSTHFQSKLF